MRTPPSPPTNCSLRRQSAAPHLLARRTRAPRNQARRPTRRESRRVAAAIQRKQKGRRVSPRVADGIFEQCRLSPRPAGDQSPARQPGLAKSTSANHGRPPGHAGAPFTRGLSGRAAPGFSRSGQISLDRRGGATVGTARRNHVQPAVNRRQHIPPGDGRADERGCMGFHHLWPLQPGNPSTPPTLPFYTGPWASN